MQGRRGVDNRWGGVVEGHTEGGAWASRDTSKPWHPPLKVKNRILRRRRHDYELIPKTRKLNINYFIMLMLYKNSY